MIKVKIVDAHVHLGIGFKMQLGVETLLRQMDEANVDYAIICPMDRFIAMENKEGNEYVARIVRQYSDRIAGMASVNPWSGKKGADELKRALEDGLCGLKLHSVLQGFRLCDPIVYPLLEIAEEYDVPVYAHTGTAGIAEPLHIAELARNFPNINFIAGHAGSSDYYHDIVRALEISHNLWIESSRNGPGNFMQWKNRNYIDRIVFGTNAPEYIPEVELENMRDIFTEPHEQQSIFEINIQNVFKGRLKI